ncbi:MAG: hypothetical protein AMXMBFR55_16350 [Gemmatimonadota bacterium]
MSLSTLRLLLDAHRVKRQGPAAVAARQRTRLAEIVSFARTHSPYYRKLYARLTDRVEDPSLLPVTDKKRLMARFDDWATDREVSINRVRAFVDAPDLVGERFLGRYTVATTSGTTGTQGVFLIDDRSLAVAKAMAFRMLSAWLGAADVVAILARGARLAMVNATGGHFASAVAAVRLTRGRSKRVRVFPVRMPLHEMVTELNRFCPAVLAPYASVGALLAAEQRAGRLHIDPVLVVLSAEGLTAAEYERVGEAFGAKVRDSYAATECPFLSYRCAHEWLHVNADWVALEPVDTEHRPVPPGEQSHTVLISNLANRVQPILRYDLGDGVLLRPDPCPCGDPLPAIRVQGRAADVLTFPGRDDQGERVTIAPLLFGTVVDRVPGIELFQVVQTTPITLCIRLRVADGADLERVWQALRDELTHLLSERGLEHVAVERAEEAPEQSPGGKYREVIPLPEGQWS